MAVPTFYPRGVLAMQYTGVNSADIIAWVSAFSLAHLDAGQVLDSTSEVDGVLTFHWISRYSPIMPVNTTDFVYLDGTTFHVTTATDFAIAFPG